MRTPGLPTGLILAYFSARYGRDDRKSRCAQLLGMRAEADEFQKQGISGIIRDIDLKFQTWQEAENSIAQSLVEHNVPCP